MASNMSYDVIIVGGGIAGLTSAAYLSKAGYRVLLCEKSAKTGGLVNTFSRQGFTFDAGIRALENSGIIFPMLKQLGIELDYVPNPISIGIENKITRLRNRASLSAYQAMLCGEFPQNAAEIAKIVHEIEKVMKYMDVIYEIDNPLFLDLAGDRKYLFGTLLPWLVKYQYFIRKAQKLNQPINDYLRRFTQNQALIDVITQHFFKNTPTYFALSYFGLFLDYFYPLGGTGSLVDKMAGYIAVHHGEIAVNTEVCGVNVAASQVQARDGRVFGYRELIWCADMKCLYSAIDLETVGNQRQRTQIAAQKLLISQNHGADSILTLFMSVNLDHAYFENICGAHTFYTPEKDGLSSLDPDSWKIIIHDSQLTGERKQDALKKWLAAYFALTTFEISCPALRDASLAPEGMTGVIASTLMPYTLVRAIADAGWYEVFKHYCAEIVTAVLGRTLFPELPGSLLEISCSTPLTIEKLTGNYQGAIVGWSFTNQAMPAQNKFLRMAKSVMTPVPDIFQAGQWTFSPSGLPAAIVTGKFAADAARKKMGV